MTECDLCYEQMVDSEDDSCEKKHKKIRRRTKICCEMCQTCLKTSVRVQIAEGSTELECPGCDARFIDGELDDLFDLFENNLLAKLYARNQSLQFHTSSNENESVVSLIDAFKCINLTKEEDTRIRQCPRCDQFIQLRAGCDSVECPTCQYRFCFNCLQHVHRRHVSQHAKLCKHYEGFDTDGSSSSESDSNVAEHCNSDSCSSDTSSSSSSSSSEGYYSTYRR